jgi:hypothetical protein
MTSAAIVFFASFISVFALGLQSLNVNQGQYGLASLTSIIICTGSLGLFKVLPESGIVQIAAYFVGCNLGILTSMWSHPRLKRWWGSRNKT